jgi:hypothetical protein
MWNRFSATASKLLRRTRRIAAIEAKQTHC